MALFGPDLSNNNWNSAGEIASWLDACFHREGYSWMEHKVSEGNYYADPFWPAVLAWCNANGVPCIGYHYVTTNDAASQVAKFVANGGGKFVMLDFEANSGDIGNFWAVVNAFNAAGVEVALSYIPHWYWQQIGSPDLSKVPGLVSSAYYERGQYGSQEYADAGGDSGNGWAAYGGATPAIWQFSDGAIIDGKSVDANAFKGSMDDLKVLLGVETKATGGVVAATPNKPTDTGEQVSEMFDQLRLKWEMLGWQSPVEALAQIRDKVCGTADAGKKGARFDG